MVSLQDVLGKAIEEKEPNIKLEVLSEALDVINLREKEYGEAGENLELIASLWSMYLAINLSKKDVALMMVLLKIARAKHPKYHKDNFVDMCGYAALAADQGK